MTPIHCPEIAGAPGLRRVLAAFLERCDTRRALALPQLSRGPKWEPPPPRPVLDTIALCAATVTSYQNAAADVRARKAGTPRPTPRLLPWEAEVARADAAERKIEAAMAALSAAMALTGAERLTRTDMKAALERVAEALGGLKT